MIDELYKVKLVRDFLSLYSETKWPALVLNLVQIGILTLRKNFNVASLSLEDIESYVDDMKTIEAEEEKRKKRRLKAQETEYSAKKPSSAWRKGDRKVFEHSRQDSKQDSRQDSVSSKKSNYPSWWTEESKVTKGEKSFSSKKPVTKVSSTVYRKSKSSVQTKQQPTLKYRTTRYNKRSNSKNSETASRRSSVSKFSSKKMTNVKL